MYYNISDTQVVFFQVVTWDIDVSEVHAASWRWKQQGPPKRLCPTASLFGVTAHKTATWIFM